METSKYFAHYEALTSAVEALPAQSAADAILENGPATVTDVITRVVDQIPEHRIAISDLFTEQDIRDYATYELDMENPQDRSLSEMLDLALPVDPSNAVDTLEKVRTMDELDDLANVLKARGYGD